MLGLTATDISNKVAHLDINQRLAMPLMVHVCSLFSMTQKGHAKRTSLKPDASSCRVLDYKPGELTTRFRVGTLPVPLQLMHGNLRNQGSGGPSLLPLQFGQVFIPLPILSKIHPPY